MYQEAIEEVTKDGVKDKAKEEAMAKAKEEYHPVDWNRHQSFLGRYKRPFYFPW